MVRCRTRSTTLPCALAWLALSPRVARVHAAVSADDLLALAGSDATGQVLTTAAYSLTMIANSTSCLVSLSSEATQGELGWMGFGVGTQMAGADIVVLWPNTDGSWTLSHRNAASTVMPTDTGSDALTELSIVPSLSSSSADDPAVITFTRPLSVTYTTDAEIKDLAQEINQPIIYALGPTNPGNSDPTTDIEQHSLDSMGATYMDLSAAFTSSAVDAPLYSITGSSGGATSAAGGGASGGGGSSKTASGSAGATTAAGGAGESNGATGGQAESTGAGGAGGGGSAGATSTATTKPASSSSTSTAATPTGSSAAGSTSYATIIKYHALVAASAWVIAAPMGVLIARLGRGCAFFPYHWGVQVFVTTSLTTLAVGLAFYSTRLKTTTVTKDAHVYLGFAILLLVYAQCGLGLYIHLAGMAASAAEKARGRAPRNWLHFGLGISLLIGGFVQVKLGMTKYGVSSKSNWTYIYWGAIGLFTTMYTISALMAIANPPPPPPAPRKPHHHESGHKHKRHHKHPHHHTHHKGRPHHKAHHRRRRRPEHKHKRRGKEEEKELMSSESESETSGSGSGSDSDSQDSSASSRGGRSRSESDSGSDRRRRRK